VIGFTGNTLDRADTLRHDVAAFAAAASDWRARLLKLDGLMPDVTEEGRLAWTTLADLPDDAVPILLGLDEGRPHFTAFLPGFQPSSAPAMRSPALMAMLASLAPGEAAIYAAARSLIDWHARHRFCANCGTATDVFRAGWGRKCPNCQAEHFPRVDPVTVVRCSAAARTGLPGGIPRSPAFSNPASRSRKRWRARSMKRPACASARYATSPASPGLSRPR
jgi:NAD+ diphosphatase